MYFSTHDINSIEKDYDEVREAINYSSMDVILRRAARRLGPGIAEGMTDRELLNFVEGN